MREHVYGLHYTHDITYLNAMCGCFNSRRENKAFTVINEVCENQYKKHNNNLKAVITDKYFQVECKGIEAYEAICQSNFVAISNNLLMTKIDNSDRRHDAIECDNSNTLSNNHEYFDRLGKDLNDTTGSNFFIFLQENIFINGIKEKYQI